MSRVLIIDDDDVIAGALFQHLISNGVSADLALDPTQADTLLSENDYALVLMDAYLTGQLNNRALELLDHVRSRRPRAHVVLLTAYGSRALSDRVHGDDRITVMAKPQPVAFLSELINAYLSPTSSP